MDLVAGENDGRVESGALFRARVESLVARIPVAKVMTYGQIAAICGSPRAARIVGGIAHFGDPQLPWQRVVNSRGGLAVGFPGGREEQARRLRDEGVRISDKLLVDLGGYLWRPGK